MSGNFLHFLDDDDWLAHYAKNRREIALWLDDPSGFTPQGRTRVPPGSPIGG